MGKFVVRRTAAGCKFDLKAANGEIIATSEVYASLAACVKGAKSVARCAAAAAFADLTAGKSQGVNPKFELYRDRSGAYRFRLLSRNGKIIAASEPYGTKAACLVGIESVRGNAAEASIETAAT